MVCDFGLVVGLFVGFLLVVICVLVWVWFLANSLLWAGGLFKLLVFCGLLVVNCSMFCLFLVYWFLVNSVG